MVPKEGLLRIGEIVGHSPEFIAFSNDGLEQLSEKHLLRQVVAEPQNWSPFCLHAFRIFRRSCASPSGGLNTAWNVVAGLGKGSAE
jgi:hypothetical protein